jgi:transposase
MPVFHALMEYGSFTGVLVCNAAHVKNVPGRKTDAADAAWLAELLEVGLLRGSFIAPEQVKTLQDLVRYRSKLVEARGSETQRLSKTLEDAGIKLDSVASNVIGVSSRKMIEALIDGNGAGRCWPIWRWARYDARARTCRWRCGAGSATITR